MAGLKVVLVNEDGAKPSIELILSLPNENAEDYNDLLNWLKANAIPGDGTRVNDYCFMEKRKILTVYARGCSNIPDDVTFISFATMIKFRGIIEVYKADRTKRSMQVIIRLFNLNR